jgi:hypothetical protein
MAGALKAAIVDMLLLCAVYKMREAGERTANVDVVRQESNDEVVC